jgi:hypothetical protein
MFSWMKRKSPQATAEARRRRVEARPSVDSLEERVVLNAPNAGTDPIFFGNQGTVVGGRVIDAAPGGSTAGGTTAAINAGTISSRLAAQAAAERSISGGRSASSVALQNFNRFNNTVNQLSRQYQQQVNRFNQLATNQSNLLTRQLNSRMNVLAQQYQRGLARGQAPVIDTSLVQQQILNQQQRFAQQLNQQFATFQGSFRNQLAQLGTQASTFGTPYAAAFQNLSTAFDTGLGYFGNEGVRNGLQVIDTTLGSGLNNISTFFNNAAANPFQNANAFRTNLNSVSTDFGRTLGSSVGGFNQTLNAGLTTLNSSNNTNFSNFYNDLNRFYFTPGNTSGGSGGAGSGSGLPGGGNVGTGGNVGGLPGTGTVNPPTVVGIGLR